MSKLSREKLKLLLDEIPKRDQKSTRDAVGKAMGLTGSSVYRWLPISGKVGHPDAPYRTHAPEQIEAVARVLKVHPSDLLYHDAESQILELLTQLFGIQGDTLPFDLDRTGLDRESLQTLLERSDPQARSIVHALINTYQSLGVSKSDFLQQWVRSVPICDPGFWDRITAHLEGARARFGVDPHTPTAEVPGALLDAMGVTVRLVAAHPRGVDADEVGRFDQRSRTLTLYPGVAWQRGGSGGGAPPSEAHLEAEVRWLMALEVGYQLAEGPDRRPATPSHPLTLPKRPIQTYEEGLRHHAAEIIAGALLMPTQTYRDALRRIFEAASISQAALRFKDLLEHVPLIPARQIMPRLVPILRSQFQMYPIFLEMTRVQKEVRYRVDMNELRKDRGFKKDPAFALFFESETNHPLHAPDVADALASKTPPNELKHRIDEYVISRRYLPINGAISSFHPYEHHCRKWQTVKMLRAESLDDIQPSTHTAGGAVIRIQKSEFSGYERKNRVLSFSLLMPRESGPVVHTLGLSMDEGSPVFSLIPWAHHIPTESFDSVGMSCETCEEHLYQICPARAFRVHRRV